RGSTRAKPVPRLLSPSTDRPNELTDRPVEGSSRLRPFRYRGVEWARRAPAGGFEPPTKGLTVPCATAALRRHEPPFYARRSYRGTSPVRGTEGGPARAARPGPAERARTPSRLSVGRAVGVSREDLLRQRAHPLRGVAPREGADGRRRPPFRVG